MTVSFKVNMSVLSELYGRLDVNAQTIENEFNVKLSANGDQLLLSGEDKDVEYVQELIHNLILLIGEGYEISKAVLYQSIELVRMDKADEILPLFKETVAVSIKGKAVKCRTIGQRDYVKAIGSHTITICAGPAGTGKTYLAVAIAVNAYKNGEVEKIILTRPAIEAGEKLGFLPGDLQEKIDPYLRPLYDALGELFGTDSSKLIERGIIEIAPLAYMRGRTLKNAFIILDEAQNTTSEQMKMFLTRLGEGSKMVIAGDLTQIDLPFGKYSGLIEAVKVLANIEDIAIIQLSDKDVVRHELVQRIVLAYERLNNREETKFGGK